MAGITAYSVLLFAAGNDIMAIKLHLSINDITWFFRIGLFVLPPIMFWVTKRICLSLQRRDRDTVLHGRETGTIVRTPDGRFFERHETSARAHARAVGPGAARGRGPDRDRGRRRRERRRAQGAPARSGAGPGSRGSTSPTPSTRSRRPSSPRPSTTGPSTRPSSRRPPAARSRSTRPRRRPTRSSPGSPPAGTDPAPARSRAAHPPRVRGTRAFRAGSRPVRRSATSSVSRRRGGGRGCRARSPRRRRPRAPWCATARPPPA